MKIFDSKEELDKLFDLFKEANNDITPTGVINFYKRIEDKLTEIYECGFNDGTKFNNELSKLLKPKIK